jgi:uncharacterized protein (DUF433 family)
MDHTHFEDRILIDPAVAFGKPVIRGTRVPVYLIADVVEDGATSSEIVDDYPELTEADVAAALAFVVNFKACTDVRAL